MFDDHVITIRDMKVNTDGTELAFPGDEECATLRTCTTSSVTRISRVLRAMTRS